MPRIKCLYEDCVFILKGFCFSATIELDPEDGCLNYSEEPMDINRAEFDEDEVNDDNWEDEGFQELEDLALEKEDDDF